MTKKNRELKICGDVLLDQIKKLGAVGTDPLGGRTRLALSEEDRQGRDMVVGWMKDLGLEVRIDRVGNIFAILEGADKAKKSLMVGSHIDTVVQAGPYDGCYGVLSGLAVARAYKDSGALPARTLVIGAFTDEEGARFQPDMLGSLVYVGGMSLEEAYQSKDENGILLGDALKAIGYDGDEEPGFIQPGEYLELHIEQGPRLDAENLSIGVVEGVQGISWWRVSITGKANHAGTTPTNLRHDAGLAAAKVSVALRDHALATGTTLAAIGTISFEPNVVNVIPSRAEFTVDLRDPDEKRLGEAEEKLTEILERVAKEEGVEVKKESLARFAPVVFDPDLVAVVEEAVKARGHSYMPMVSGAGHDAQMMARIAPTAMIFVPSVEGISHNPAEHTSPEDLIMGAEVLLDVVQRLMDS